MIWLLVLALAVQWFGPIRESNSRAATARGVKEFEKQQYGKAVESFAEARAASSTPQSAYNLGTAQVAAGLRADGSATLAAALKDPKLRADALYNRGNSALAAKAFDYAVRDYAEVLRLRPSDARAKRNLEIALARRAQQKQSGGQDRSSKQQGAGGQKPQPAPANQQQKQAKQGEADHEALLRAIQQQEREELSRMNRAGRDRARVGW